MAIYTTPDSYTKLLIHSDHANSSSDITDSSASKHTITIVNSLTHSTSQQKFGASSLNFSANPYLQLAASSDWAVGGGDFTIDFWWYPNNLNRVWFFAGLADYRLALAYKHNTSNGLEMWASANGTSWNLMGDSAGNKGQSAGDEVVAEQWQHIAMVRSGDRWITFHNGIIVTDVEGTADVTSSLNLGIKIGLHAGSAYHANGYYDEFRWSTGIARWTSNFTPPNKPYDIINTDTQTLDAKEDSAFEVTGGGNTQFGSSIVVRSDPGEAASDSVFSVNSKDGTELVNVRADGKAKINQPIVRYGNSDSTHPGMFRYGYRAFYGHSSAGTDTITVLSGQNSAYANHHAIIEAWMAHNNGDNWAYTKYFVWVNYQGTGTHASKELIHEAGSGANSIAVVWNGSTYGAAFTTTGGQNGYMSYDVLSSHEDAIIIH